MSSGGSFGASSLEQEIGLGRATSILSLTIYWPATGISQSFEDVPLDSRIEVREGRDVYTILDTEA